MKPSIEINRHIVLLLCLLSAFICLAQNKTDTRCHYLAEDSVTIERLLADKQLQTTIDFARQLMGRPYVAHTLELFPDRERLIVNTRELDCTTLIENVVALVRCRQAGEQTFADFCRQLCQLRYRNGICQGYTSRLHYFSDWIEDKHRMGMVTEIQEPDPPFSAVQTLKTDYMSRHPQAYKSLQRHPLWVKTIARQEQELTGRKYRYIPKNRVLNTAVMRQAVRDGDIVAITCNKPGLDIAHLGFACWKKDGLHLLNASQLHGKVVLESMTLGQYLSRHPSHTGIRIVRLSQ